MHYNLWNIGSYIKYCVIFYALLIFTRLFSSHGQQIIHQKCTKTVKHNFHDVEIQNKSLFWIYLNSIYQNKNFNYNKTKEVLTYNLAPLESQFKTTSKRKIYCIKVGQRIKLMYTAKWSPNWDQKMSYTVNCLQD